MNTALIETSVTWTFLILIAAEVLFYFRALHYVRGSYPRYVCVSLQKCCEIGIIISLLAFATLNLMEKDTFGVALDVVLIVYRVWIWVKRFNNDDHWFNKQWKRLKRGLKKLKQQLATLVPLPMPSPA